VGATGVGSRSSGGGAVNLRSGAGNGCSATAGRVEGVASWLVAAVLLAATRLRRRTVHIRSKVG
jgi:uncharacterized protein (TIGR03382 family)